jgi:uncharacterized membrane protein YkoI
MKNLKNDQTGVAHLAISVVGGSCFMVYQGQSNKSKQHDANQTANVQSTINKLPDDLKGVETFDQVKQHVEAKKPGAKIAAVELEQEGSSLVHKVKLVDKSMLAFNAHTGDSIEIKNNDQDEDENEDDPVLPATSPTIDVARARKLAFVQQQGTIKKIKLKSEDGKLAFSVRFNDKARVDIDAVTGAVMRSDPAKKSIDSKPETENETKDNTTKTETEATSNETNDDKTTTSTGSNTETETSGSSH